MALESTPLVSALVVCKDARASIRRCIESLLAQDHPRLEIIVQDGASTDETLEILRSYGNRLDLVSEPDRDQNDAFLCGLARCRGDVIGFCWADEEWLPQAARRGVELLSARPELGAIYGNFIATDLDGAGDEIVEYPEWSFERVFTYEFIPPFCSAFFRRKAIERTFMPICELAPDCTEYMLWAGVGAHYPVAHTPEVLARYARHANQLSMRATRVSAYPAKIIAGIRALVRDPAMPASLHMLTGRACAHVHLWAAQTLLDSDGDSADWSQHVEQALAFEPTPVRLTLFHFESLKRFLREGRPQRMLELLEITARRGVCSAGLCFARALALFALGRHAEAQALEAEIAADPYLEDLLELIENLLDHLVRDEQNAVVEHAIGVFWRLGEIEPAFLYRLAILLGRLGRYEEAIAAGRRYLEAIPGHGATLGLIDQLELAICLRQIELRTELATLTGRHRLDMKESFPFAHTVWRCLLNPAAIERLPAAKRAATQRLVAIFERGAERASFASLQARLHHVGLTLGATTPEAAAP